MSWQQAQGAIPYAAASFEDELLFQQLQSHQPQHQNLRNNHSHNQHQNQQSQNQLTSQPMYPTTSSSQYMNQSGEKILHPPTPDCAPIDQSQIDRIARDYINDLRVPTMYSTMFNPASSTVSGGADDGISFDPLMMESNPTTIAPPLQTPAPTSEDLLTNQQFKQMQMMQTMAKRQNQNQQYLTNQHPQPHTLPHLHRQNPHFHPNPDHHRQTTTQIPATATATATNYSQYNTNYDDFDFLSENWNEPLSSSFADNPTTNSGMSTNSLPQQHGSTRQNLASVPAPAEAATGPTGPVTTPKRNNNNNNNNNAVPTQRTSPSKGQQQHYSRPNYGLGVSVQGQEHPAPVPAKSVVKKPSFIFSNSSVDDMSRNRIVKKKSSRNLRKAKKDLTSNVNNSVKTPAKKSSSSKIGGDDKSSPTTIPLSATVQKPREHQQQHEHYYNGQNAANYSPTPASRAGFSLTTTSGGGSVSESPAKGIFRSVTSRSNSIAEPSKTPVESMSTPQQQPPPQIPTRDLKRSQSKITPDMLASMEQHQAAINSNNGGSSTGMLYQGQEPKKVVDLDSNPLGSPLHADDSGSNTAAAGGGATIRGSNVTTAGSGNTSAELAQGSGGPAIGSDPLLDGFDFESLGVPEANWDDFQAQAEADFNWNPLDAAEELAKRE